MHDKHLSKKPHNMMKSKDIIWNIPASEISCDTNIGFDWGASGNDEINTPGG